MVSNSDEQYMRLAIDAARRGIQAGQAPFGAAVVRDGKPVAVTHNHVWMTIDVTAHAEIHCIRLACQLLETIDLSGCTIYSTTEPCPMCFCAIHWARIDRIVFGVALHHAATAGFNELPISNMQMKQLGRAPVAVKGGCLAAECAELFGLWAARADAHRY